MSGIDTDDPLYTVNSVNCITVAINGGQEPDT